MRRATFWFVFVTVLLDMLAIGIIVPVLPKLVIQLEGGNEATAAAMFGLFGTVWAAMQFLFAPVLGALSDRVGRRPVILISCLGLALDYVIMALAPTVAWLFVGRVLSGITASGFATSFAYIADVTEPNERAGRFGLLGTAFGIGFILGPAVGGILGGISLRAPFWAAGAVSLLGAVYGWFVLPESLPRERRSPFLPGEVSAMHRSVLAAGGGDVLAAPGCAAPAPAPAAESGPSSATAGARAPPVFPAATRVPFSPRARP